MVRTEIDGIEFKLREFQDFSWLNEYGKVFSVIDETGSGCIMFGVEKNGKKLFFKIAGAKTVEAEVSEETSIALLKDAVQKYRDISHPNLIKLVDSFHKNEFFVAIFEWVDGECLFDHWNFDKYNENPDMDTPMKKFKRLPVAKRMAVVEKLFSFFQSFIESGYVAVDFYDSSIMYDFEDDSVTFCDIDLFRKAPTANDLGENYFGTKRLKSPEENEFGATIDELTSEFTLGAIIFDMFSDLANNQERYEKGMFIPNTPENFELSKGIYNILKRATDYDRSKRYKTIAEFCGRFMSAVEKEGL